jgi:CMP-N-acetylneuraminic acid synthetase
VSSNDPEVLTISRRVAAAAAKPFTVVERPEHLCIQSTSMDDVALHACDVIGEATIVWAFVTSPMVEAADYDAMIRAYEQVVAAGTHDSLMTVTPMHKFLWTASGPFNYTRTPLKWPRSQDLPVVYDANQACFILSDAVSRACADRVGNTPLLYELSPLKAIDVDWEDDFLIAQELYRSKGVQF